MGNQEQAVLHWSPPRLLAFRFASLYLVLYNLPFPLGALPYTDALSDKYQILWETIVPWVGKHILHLRRPVAYTPYIGDTPYEYVNVFCFLVLALVGAAVWSASKRAAANHDRLQAWLFFYVRLAVGAALLSYGAGKIFQRQFADPDLYKLLQPHGEAPLMDLLWTFMGASRGYRIFTGCVELLAGILLFIPQTATIGALIGIAALTNVFVLNIFYGVWVKLYSFHLLLMCAVLVLPQTRRLLNFFVLNRTAEPERRTPLFSGNRANRGALAMQICLCGVLVCYNLAQARALERQQLAARPPFYGIWMVDEFSYAGNVVPPLLTDNTRWQRVIFEYPKGVGIQSMSGSWHGYRLERDMEKKTLRMEKNGEPPREFAFEFTFSSTDPQSLALDGRDAGNAIHVTLHRVDEKRFALMDQKIHWINE